MAEFDLESIIKKGVEEAINKPVYGGMSITEWVAIGMKAPQWFSVKDRLPDLEDQVLIVYEWTGRSGAKYREIALDSFKAMGFLGYKPLFWMPLPELPKEVSEDD